jgi:hypothetical protein
MDSVSIAFRKRTESLGRNGVMKMAGIHVSRHADALYVAPITSRMQIGRAWILVPLDAVGDVAKAMLDVSGTAQSQDAAKRAA